jgi:putative copper export protein
VFLGTSGAQIVLWLHILAACVWIGGQITLGALVPVLRGNRTLVSAAARRYAQIAWPAFAVLILTGIANIRNAGIDGANLTGTPTGRTLVLKLVFVLISGAAAALHSYVVGPRASASPTRATRAANGILGALALLAALAAAFYGVVIAEH